MKKEKAGNLELFKFNKFSEFPEIKHFVTTREGGVSSAPYNSLNLGFGTDDFSINVLENRHRLAESTGIPLDYFVMANQVHGTNIAVVTRKQRGMGALYRDNSLLETDAMITNEKEICLFIMNADCVPVLFYDPVNKIIGAAHAGWRGTVKKIAALTALKMRDYYDCKLSDIQVGIGPSIGPCCYEVGEEVQQHVADSFGTIDTFIQISSYNDKPVFDLWYANQYQLIEAGIKKENIEVSGLCTLCNQDDFFSSRGGAGDTGRFGAGIMLL